MFLSSFYRHSGSKLRKKWNFRYTLEVTSQGLCSINIFWLANTKGKLVMDIILFMSNHVVNTLWSNLRLHSLMWLKISFLRRSGTGKKGSVNLLRKFRILCMQKVRLSLHAQSAWREQIFKRLGNQWSHCSSTYTKNCREWPKKSNFKVVDGLNENCESEQQVLGIAYIKRDKNPWKSLFLKNIFLLVK